MSKAEIETVSTWDYETDQADSWMRNVMEYSVRPWKYSYGLGTFTDRKQDKVKTKFGKKLTLRGRKEKASKSDLEDQIIYGPPDNYVKPELLSLIHRRMSMN
ncbi:MAG: hypothetical protein JW891_04995 [Candidatus Lokiarchaeota archaeon]|nr:hypothetical protein [Candidatus Lokiarchaeota archaeon]